MQFVKIIISVKIININRYKFCIFQTASFVAINLLVMIQELSGGEPPQKIDGIPPVPCASNSN